MNTKKLTAAIATTALVVSVPLVTLYAEAAAAAPHHTMGPTVEVTVGAAKASRADLGSKPAPARVNNSERASRAAATSRLSGLPFGGAALFDPQTAPPMNAKAITNAERAARAAATSRLSGLPFGGAALDA
jgi:hypothetical protein